MPYVYPEVDDLDGHDLVGTHQCAALVQAFAGAPRTSDWRQGVSGQGRELDRCEQQWRCLLGDRMTTNRLLAALLAPVVALGAPRISAAAETVGKAGSWTAPIRKACGSSASTPAAG